MPLPPIRSSPASRVVAAFNLVAFAGWLPYARASATARAYLVAHVVVAALLAAGAWRRPTRPPPLRRWPTGARRRALRLAGRARDAYPLLVIALAWRELGVRHAFVHGTERDALLRAADLALVGPALGGHANLVWAPAMPALSPFMHAAYFAFTPLLVLVALALTCASCPRRRREGVLRLAVTFLGCFALYTAFPFDGPLTRFPRYTAGVADGWFFRANVALRAAGDSLGTAFPSSHVAGSVTLAWVAARCGPRWAAWALGALAGAIVLAVVYTQNHLAVDALAGLAVAAALQAVVAPRLLRRRAAAPSRRPAAVTLRARGTVPDTA